MGARGRGGPLASGPNFGRLTVEQCERLHEATLHVLERTGLVMEEPEALELVKKAGAEVDGTRVRIPGALVEWALDTAPNSVTLWDRDGREACRLEGYRTSFGPGSDCMYCLDHRTSTRRRAVLQDVVEAAVVTDACENYDFAMSVFSPSDVTPELLDRYQMEAMLTNTSKPIVFVTFGGDESHLDAVNMAEAVVGKDQLTAKPIIACYKNTLFPLVHNREALSTLLYLAERNLPCIYSPVSTAGTVAPMTVLGCVAIVNAGILAGLVVSQLKREGAPFIAIGWAGEAMDMRTMVDVYAAPDHRAILATLMHYYDLPMWTLGGVSDSKLPDEQAAAEAALTLMADALAGGHMIHDIGYLESAYCGSLSQLVLCNDIVGWVKQLMAPVEIDDESLALDVIDQVGPGGLFLMHKHTRRHARDRFQPRVLDRESHEDWLAHGGLDATARAAARVDEILASHVPEPLPKDVRRALRKVVEDAEEGLRSGTAQDCQ
jgi:trimethylamine--corrinoid protein Co-methyltransferase